MNYEAAIRTESARFYDTADRADPSRPVPSCPEWTIGDLVWHLAEVHSFWSIITEMRLADGADAEPHKPPRPDDYGELVALGRTQADRLVAALEATPDEVAVWTWALSETDHSVGFIRRHQVQEAAVHRFDLQQAAGLQTPEPVDPEAASDSIDEVLAILLPWGVRPDKPLTGSVHVHCTDTPGEWFVLPDGRVEPIHAKGDAAIRGTASDLLLVIYKRLGVDRVEIIGDRAVADELLARIDGS